MTIMQDKLVILLITLGFTQSALAWDPMLISKPKKFQIPEDRVLASRERF
jgi:hypothetical protein